MTILYLSSLSSIRQIEQIHSESGLDPGYAIQRFNRLIVKGLLDNSVKVIPLSAVPVNHKIAKRVFWRRKIEKEDDISYHYIPFVNLYGIRQICLFLYSFLYVYFWGIIKRDDKAIICDALSISICLGAQIASKLNGLKSIGILTDMPGLMVFGNGKKQSIITSLNFLSLSLYTHYVFLTEEMNSVINRKNRPYIIVEGVTDVRANVSVLKESPRVVMYAGSLHEKYGLKLLVQSFLALNKEDVQLVLYGTGPFVNELQDICSKTDRIKYRGLIPPDSILRAECSATLLVNPRPTSEVFTKYSFPSKNLEYMASGTPLLTTRLPGIPKDHYPFVFFFDEESVTGFSNKLNQILSLPPEDLKTKGKEAQMFVLNNKNNTIQAARILSMLG